MTFILADRNHPLRSRLERAVQSVFLAEYAARVSSFPERLMASLAADGTPLAVTGLRNAGDGLFSQCYLDSPVEDILSSRLGQTVQRGEIVEFSSLAACHPGAAMPLVMAAIRLSRDSGASFGLFTATRRLRLLLRRHRLDAIDLGPALAGRRDDACLWGSYYLHDPRVMVIAADTLPEHVLSGAGALMEELSPARGMMLPPRPALPFPGFPAPVLPVPAMVPAMVSGMVSGGGACHA